MDRRERLAKLMRDILAEKGFLTLDQLMREMSRYRLGYAKHEVRDALTYTISVPIWVLTLTGRGKLRVRKRIARQGFSFYQVYSGRILVEEIYGLEDVDSELLLRKLKELRLPLDRLLT